MKRYRVYISIAGKDPVPITIMAKDPAEARMIAVRQYGRGSVANGGYIEEMD